MNTVKVEVEGKTFTLRRWSWREKNRFMARWQGRIDPKTGRVSKPEEFSAFNDDLLLSVVEGLNAETLEQMDWALGERLLNEAVKLNFLAHEERRDFLGPSEAG